MFIFVPCAISHENLTISDANEGRCRELFIHLHLVPEIGIQVILLWFTVVVYLSKSLQLQWILLTTCHLKLFF